jgi:3-hydroxybutyryl-CoA dehydrogenase
MSATSDRTIGVIGAGTMGTGIAYVFAAAGYAATVVEPAGSQVAKLHTSIAGAAAGAVTRGKLDAAAAEALSARISCVPGIAQLGRGLSLVVESVPERLDVKQAVLREVEARDPLVIASNTSSISIDELATVLERPDRFIGMHFFNPVWSLALVELIRGDATADDTLATAQRFVSDIGKKSIVVRNIPGFATSRLDLIASLEAMRMLEDGVASAEDIDRAAELAYRHPVGPLRLSDIVGLDVRLDIARQLESVYGDRYRPPQILIDKVAAGHLGQKSGRGFHVWPSP